MSILLHGDCLEELKSVDDESIDLIFCDLPYVDSKGKGQTSCSWNQSAIDLDKLWIEFMRVKKLNTPLFFTTTTKFGVELINSSPKKLKFFDLVWIKSAPTAFLLSKKFPLRKHEMIYVFYEKLPFYDLSSHKHKFLNSKNGMKGQDNLCYGSEVKQVQNKKYDPPLPVSVVKEEGCYGGAGTEEFKGDMKGKYDPPLPVSVVKEDYETCDKPDRKTMYGKVKIYEPKRRGEPRYDPPLPNTALEIKSTRGKHSTEKPVALMEWILKYYSKEGDVILDPTMGSAPMGVAAKNMNRNFIGIEKDPEIYEVAVNRIEN